MTCSCENNVKDLVSKPRIMKNQLVISKLNLVLCALIFCAGTGTCTAQTFYKPTLSMIMISWSVGSYNKNFFK